MQQFINSLYKSYQSELREIYKLGILDDLLNISGKELSEIRRNNEGNVVGYAGLKDCLFLYLLVREFKPKIIFEIGTWIGASSSFMAEALERNNQGKLYTCDINQYNCIPDCYNNRVVYINDHSSQALERLKEFGEKIDLVFADGEVDETTANLLYELKSTSFIFATHDFKPPRDKGIANLLQLKHQFLPSEFKWLIPTKQSIGYDVGESYRLNKSVAVMIPDYIYQELPIFRFPFQDSFQYWLILKKYYSMDGNKIMINTLKKIMRKVPIIYPLYQKIKKNNEKADQFSTIKSLTNGYLSPEAYKAIYDCAYQAQSGNMIDIGPAQGGSTISIGLGIRDSGKAGKCTVYSIEKCVGSNALPSLNNQDLNASTLKRNVEQYGLSNICKILVGDVKEVANDINLNESLSLMFIDADGALDRDFKLFYNRLLPGAPIILDDYLNKINHHASERYLKWSTEEEINSYVASKGAESFVDLFPLGKEYTVYRFVNYFMEQNLIKLDRVIGTTFFGYKTEDGVFDPKLHGSGLMKIREEILNRYYELNENFKGKPVQ